jgi:hypothetical protein
MDSGSEPQEVDLKSLVVLVAQEIFDRLLRLRK